ncbi:MAG: hypothetical protein LBB89_12385 [Treponema sp.]|nr:hypothetical protein [Treponema sp.]
MMKPLSERIQEYKAIGYIAGVKVLERLKLGRKNIEQNLPYMSNTPGTSYLLLTKSGDAIKKFREYGDNRKPSLDIDFDHDHGYGKPHIHYWKDGERIKEGRKLVAKERKKYAKILKAAGY